MTQRIKVGVCGACGKMGQAVINAVRQEKDLELVAAIDVINVGGETGGVKIEDSLKKAMQSRQIDVMVDFTNPELVFEHTKVILEHGVKPVIGTTGLSETQLDEIKKLSEEKGIGCLIAPNFAIGAVLMMMFAQKASKYFSNAEIIETHHNKKKDAPSGTAIKTAQLMAEERQKFGLDNCEEKETITGSRGGTTESGIHIHSVRLPGFVAHQEVIFGSAGQALTIRHDSFDRISFMPGVITSIRHIASNNDFVYGLENIL